MSSNISFNINPYSTSRTAGLDYTAFATTAREIFQSAQAASNVTANVDYSKISRTPSGLDFYSGNVSPDVSKNIALQNAGLNVNLNAQALASIQYLNTQASVRNMDGKIHIPVTGSEISNSEKAGNTLPQSMDLLKSANLAKDSQGGGNPFFAGTNSSNQDNSNSNHNSIL